MKSLSVSLLLLLVLIVVSFLFATKQNTWTPPSKSTVIAPCNPALDSSTLLDIYQVTGGSNWFSDTMPNTSFRWLEDYAMFDVPISDWPGVRLNEEGCVCVLDLDGDLRTGQSISPGGIEMQNTLPNDIGKLKHLDSLFLTDNFNLGGTLPDSFYTLPNLEYAIIDVLAFTEPLRPELADMTSLRVLIADFNDWTFADVLPAAPGLQALLDRGGTYELCPQDASFPGGTISRVEGESLLVVLDVDNAPGNRYEWTWDGMPWAIFQDNDSLAFPIIRLEDAGTYQATIYNDAVPNMCIPLAPLIIEVSPANCTGEETVLVTSTADSGPGSLRSAMLCCNANPDTDTIRFNFGPIPDTIELIRPLPTMVDSGFTIIGPQGNPGRLVIDARNLGSGSNGILTRGVDNVHIERLHILGAGDDGIATDGGTGIVIINNYVDGSRGLEASGEGIFVKNGSDILIQGNTLIENGEDGIDINDGEDFAILDNVCWDNRGAGICFFNSFKGLIRGNIVGERADIGYKQRHGIVVDDRSRDTRIEGNYLGTTPSEEDVGHTEEGLEIQNQTVNISVVGNYIGFNDSSGVRLELNAQQVFISRNSIFCNEADGLQFDGPANNSQQPPNIDQATSNTVSGTIVPPATVIELYRTNTTLCSDIPVTCQGYELIDTIRVPDGTTTWEIEITPPLVVGDEVVALSHAGRVSSPFSNCVTVEEEECDNTDYETLLYFYNNSGGENWLFSGTNDDPGNTESGWGKDCDICNWYGVVCDGEQRVIELILNDNNLSGPLPDTVTSLSQLRILNLGDNPNLTGNLPANIENLGGSITLIYLRNTAIGGLLPRGIYQLPLLRQLDLGNCNFRDTIDTAIEDLSSLVALNLSENRFFGRLPEELGRLMAMSSIKLDSNEFSGELPLSFAQLPVLLELHLGRNELSGTIPSVYGNLANTIRELFLNNNRLSGCFEDELAPLCAVDQLDFSNNPALPNQGDFQSFCNPDQTLRIQLGANCSDEEAATIGETIQDDCSCQVAACEHPDYLPLMAFYRATNGRGWDLNGTNDEPTSTLAGWGQNCEPCNWYGVTCNTATNRVTRLDLDGVADGNFSAQPADGNNLVGFISDSIAQLTELEFLNLSYNGGLNRSIIPEELGNLSKLERLYLIGNGFDGRIPATLGQLSRLEVLSIVDNPRLDGLPATLGNLTHLRSLNLDSNRITDTIPTSFSNLQSLSFWTMINNRVSGTIPSVIGDISSLNYLALSDNCLEGEIPSDLANLPISTLSLHTNKLEGCIPLDFSAHCDADVRFYDNPMLPYEGVFQVWCDSNFISIGVPCKDSLPETIGEEIMPDCSCQVPTCDDDWQNGNETGVDCGGPDCSPCEEEPCEHPDYAALMALYDSTVGSNWLNAGTNADPSSTQQGWGKDCSPCEWYGISCDGTDRVQCIDLDGLSNCGYSNAGGNNLAGSIPPEIGDFPNLIYLNLSNSRLLVGAIPESIGQLSNLTAIVIKRTGITGAIPPEFRELKSLTGIDLSDNKLDSISPNVFRNLEALTFINISTNEIVSLLPQELGELVALETIILADNRFYGNLPPLYANISNLEVLFLQDNQLRGCIPEEYTALCEDIDVNLSNNLRLPWEGNFNFYCATNRSFEAQQGVVCEDGDVSTTMDQIRIDCECGCDNDLLEDDTILESASLCIGDTLFWREKVITSGGFYLDTLTGVSGCDSALIELAVEELPSLTFLREATICSGENYVFYGDTITQSGETTKVISGTEGGCDSLLTLRLTVDSVELPIIENDIISLLRSDNEVELSLIQNDSPNGPVSLEVVRPPEVGNLRIEGSRVTYIPDGTSTGSYPFVYKLCSENCNISCAEGQVELLIDKDCVVELRKKITNIITPNGDRYNNEFDPISRLAPDCAREVSLGAVRIFNKSGHLIFESPTYVAWAGISNTGRRVFSETYIYRIEVQGGDYLRGYVEVLLSND